MIVLGEDYSVQMKQWHDINEDKKAERAFVYFKGILQKNAF